MNTLKLKTKLTALILAIGIVSLAPLASAYTVYKLDDRYYAIVCADGQIFSYSGGAGGIGIVGESLCEGHGGIVGGDGGGPNVLKADAQISSAMTSCANGKPVSAQAKACPTRIRVNRIDRATPALAKPVTTRRDAASGMATGKR